MRIWTTVMGQRLDGAENTRSMLLCRELLSRGHQVTLWTSAFDHIRKIWRPEWVDAHGGAHVRADGLEIRFLRGCGYKTNVSVRRFVDHWLASRAFLNQAADLPAPDIMIASLPDHVTAAAVVAFGRKACVPTIVDVRDKWPDVFVDRIPNKPLARLADVVLLTEHWRSGRALRRADAVVASMRSMMDWGLEKAARTATWRERVFYLATFPKNFDVPRPCAPKDGAVARAVAAAAGKVVFTFVGTFNKSQHPNLILDAVDRLRDRLDPGRVAVIIAGDGVGADDVRRRVSQYSQVHAVGWVDTQEMAVLLAASSVGLLVMNFSSPAFNNKAFAYLASGLPIINGATGDLAEIIEEHRCGLNIQAGDPEALAAAMLLLASDHRLRGTLASNARNLFSERFDQTATYRAYADHVERLASERAW